MWKTIQLRLPFNLHRYTSRSRKIRFFYIAVFSAVAAIFVGTILFRSIPNRSAGSGGALQFSFQDIETDRHFIFPKKSLLHNPRLTDIKKSKNWKEEIHKFLTRVSPHFQNRSICTNYWAVAVDISEGVLQTAKQLPKWCIVVVVRHEEHTIKASNNIFFLDKTIQHELAKISPFYKESLLLPKYIYTAQKNLGYLWAIFHEATIVWDFDNANELIVDQGTLLLPLNDTVEALTVPNHNNTLFNPYPYFVSKSKNLWLRGYPFQSINNSLMQNTPVRTLHGVWPTKNLGVINSLTEGHVDVDSVYRSVRSEVPLHFKKVSSDSKTDVKLIVPRRTFSPYDEQATLHLRPALWALLLPVTVQQQVSDIFRSYAMQRLMWDVGLQTAFVGSYVIKKKADHNKHPMEKDFYLKIDHFIQLLTQWSTKQIKFIECIEQLFIALYEHQYIEGFDLHLVQLWLQELHQIGYIFPEIPPKYTVVVRTFANHLYRLNRWYLSTVNMFVDRNAFDVLFVLDDESEKDHAMGDCLKKHKYSVEYETVPILGKKKVTIPGYDRQQWSTFYMDKLSNSDYIGVIDADGMIFTFMHPFYSIFASDDDKRIMLKPMAGDHYAEDKIALQFDSGLDFMWPNRMPMWYRWETYQNLRNYITLAWNESNFDEAFVKFSKSQRYSQFSILSSYASRFETNYYRVIMNTDTRGAVSVAGNRGREPDIRIGCCRSFGIGCNDISSPKNNKDHLLRFDNSDFVALNATEKTDAYYAQVHAYLKQMPPHMVSKMKENCQLFLTNLSIPICTS